MKKILLLIALLIISLSAGRAEVLIYRGTASFRSTPANPIPPKLELFMVVDIPAKQTGFVLFFKANGQKLMSAGSPQDMNMTTAPVAGGGNARIIATGSSDPVTPDFSYFLLYFRGVQRSLLIGTDPLDVTRNEPRGITGIQLNARENSGTGDFSELGLNVHYQERSTVRANNDARTLQQTIDDLTADLAAKGYNPF